MRFKLFFSEVSKTITINVLKDSGVDIILPENLDQHLYYPIPNEMQQEVLKSIQKIIKDEDTKCLIQMEDDITVAIKKRAEAINSMRKKYNPKIMEFCQEFKMKNPEWFI